MFQPGTSFAKAAPLGAFVAATLALTPLAAAQTLNGTGFGSDRAGKAARVDVAPPDPSPAPGTRLAAQPDAQPTGLAANLMSAPVIGSHQIDRYDAIARLQKSVAANPKALSDWIILGEIAHEVAMDAPPDQAAKYFAMSSDAFARALVLDPNNAGLKAAVQFSKDQQANVDQFEKSRDAMTDTFLDARRRDLAATSNTPAIESYMPPLPSRELPGPNPANGLIAADAANAAKDVRPANVATATNTLPAPAPTPAANAATTPPPTSAASRFGNSPNAAVTNDLTKKDVANYGTQADYSAAPTLGRTRYIGPTYQPFVNQAGAPYTYQQYNNGYFPSTTYNDPTAPPVTMQRYAPTQAVPNAFERQILNRAGAGAVGTTPRPR